MVRRFGRGNAGEWEWEWEAGRFGEGRDLGVVAKDLYASVLFEKGRFGVGGIGKGAGGVGDD